MKLLTHIPAWLRNKYVVAVGVFIFIMLFFDKNDLFTQVARTRQLRELQESRQYYTNSISAQQEQLDKLRSGTDALEKFAREKYLMKKDDEDLFLVPEPGGKGNTPANTQ